MLIAVQVLVIMILVVIVLNKALPKRPKKDLYGVIDFTGKDHTLVEVNMHFRNINENNLWTNIGETSVRSRGIEKCQ